MKDGKRHTHVRPHWEFVGEIPRSVLVRAYVRLCQVRGFHHAHFQNTSHENKKYQFMGIHHELYK